ncbi:MAG: CobW family GTP-binding protein [Burkholderiales bacterium]
MGHHLTSHRIPVYVITGFLGSGKTTLLSRLLQHPGMADTAVIINEFGEVGLDHLLVASSAETMVQLAGGCLCCTLRGDLAQTLDDLFLRRMRAQLPEFQRVIIETTGLADPAPVLHTLMSDSMVSACYRSAGIITTVDAVNGDATLREHFESVKQAAMADRLVISKTDLAPPQALQELQARLKVLNPAATIMYAVNGATDPTRLFADLTFDSGAKNPDVTRWLNEEAYHDHVGETPHTPHDDPIRSFCLVRERPVPDVAFAKFLQTMVANHGADLLRLKGIVNVAHKPETPAVIHGVQHVFHPVVWLKTWPSEDRRSRIVFITRDIARDTVQRWFDALDDNADTAAGNRA